MSQTKHSPTAGPWNVAGTEIFSIDNDARICQVFSGSDSQGLLNKAISAAEADRNAAHIVRCVNSHDALVAALADCVEALAFIEERTAARTNPPTLKNARAALAKAKSE